MSWYYIWLLDLANAFTDAPVACPSSFHEFEGPEAIPYDTEGLCAPNSYANRSINCPIKGTGRGNKYMAWPIVKIYSKDLIHLQVEKEVAAYDEVIYQYRSFASLGHAD